MPSHFHLYHPSSSYCIFLISNTAELYHISNITIAIKPHDQHNLYIHLASCLNLQIKFQMWGLGRQLRMTTLPGSSYEWGKVWWGPAAIAHPHRRHTRYARFTYIYSAHPLCYINIKYTCLCITEILHLHDCIKCILVSFLNNKFSYFNFSFQFLLGFSS